MVCVQQSCSRETICVWVWSKTTSTTESECWPDNIWQVRVASADAVICPALQHWARSVKLRTCPLTTNCNWAPVRKRVVCFCGIWTFPHFIYSFSVVINDRSSCFFLFFSLLQWLTCSLSDDVKHADYFSKSLHDTNALLHDLRTGDWAWGVAFGETCSGSRWADSFSLIHGCNFCLSDQFCHLGPGTGGQISCTIPPCLFKVLFPGAI